LLRRKKDIKRIVFVFIFVALILLSNFQTFNNLSPIIDNGESDSPFNKEKDDFPLSSNSNLTLTDHITGKGNNQTVRFYAENVSYSLNNQEYFNISAPAQDTYLSSGDFNFTFQKNYTTEHVLEDDDALYPDSDSFIGRYSFNSNENYSSIKINPGMNLTEGGLNTLRDNNNDTYWVLNSSSNGRLNFTICANFSKIPNFNRSDIAGLLLSLFYNLSMDANLTIKMKDFNTNIWKNVTNTIFINSSNPETQVIDERIINENLNFISDSNCSLVQIIFNRTDLLEFNVTLYEFDLESVVLFEIPITNKSYVALEFDLRGYNTTVNGFYAWIRTLNLTEAVKVNAILNITLYKSNDTIIRDGTSSNLKKENLVPDYASKIDNILVKYSNDNLSYFKFNLSNTSNLILYNYFIVIKSNSSKNIFSLVTIPCDGTYGDSKTEHQLKNTTDCGKNWTNAKGIFDSDQLDASSFKLNVTRGYMPSDFLVNSLITLKVDNVSLVNQKIEASPYNGSIDDAWEWGKGRWNNDFSEAVKDGIDDKFRVNLTWNENVTKGFMFNVSYRAKSYNIENATCIYNITYNGVPNWILNYTLDLNKFPNWNFTEFWYIYPTYLDPHNLTTPPPNNEQVFSQTGGKEIFSENPNYNKTVVSTAIIDILHPETYNGSYLLNLTSFNCMLDVHSYINFKGNLWETNSFMFGDNISVSADIQDHNGLAPLNNGRANVTLYYPNGTRYFTDELFSTVGKKSGHVILRF